MPKYQKFILIIMGILILICVAFIGYKSYQSYNKNIPEGNYVLTGRIIYWNLEEKMMRVKDVRTKTYSNIIYNLDDLMIGDTIEVYSHQKDLKIDIEASDIKILSNAKSEEITPIKVLIAKEDIPVGTIVTEEQVSFIEIPYFEYDEVGMVTDEELVIGMTNVNKKRIKEGDYFFEYQLIKK